MKKGGVFDGDTSDEVIEDEEIYSASYEQKRAFLDLVHQYRYRDNEWARAHYILQVRLADPNSFRYDKWENQQRILNEKWLKKFLNKKLTVQLFRKPEKATTG